LAERVREFLRGGGDGLAVDLVGPAGVVAETGDYFGEVFVQSHRVGLAVVPGFDAGEGLGVGFDQGGEFVHQSAAVGGGEVAPGGVGEGGPGGGDGGVDVGGGGGVDGADLGFVGRVDAGYFFRGGGFDEFIVDEEAGGEGEFEAVGGGEVDGEVVGHFGR